jgi:hypothetical protein
MCAAAPIRAQTTVDSQVRAASFKSLDVPFHIYVIYPAS